MKISYVEHRDGTKLFSFSVHDYKEYSPRDGTFMMIDGGFDYTRYSADPQQICSWLSEAEIRDVIVDIREQFQWGRNKDKDGKLLKQTEYILLKDIKTDHLIAILFYLNTGNKGSYEKAYREIFLSELNYRYEQSIICR